MISTEKFKIVFFLKFQKTVKNPKKMSKIPKKAFQKFRIPRNVQNCKKCLKFKKTLKFQKKSFKIPKQVKQN